MTCIALATFTHTLWVDPAAVKKREFAVHEVKALTSWTRVATRLALVTCYDAWSTRSAHAGEGGTNYGPTPSPSTVVRSDCRRVTRGAGGSPAHLVADSIVQASRLHHGSPGDAVKATFHRVAPVRVLPQLVGLALLDPPYGPPKETGPTPWESPPTARVDSLGRHPFIVEAIDIRSVGRGVDARAAVEDPQGVSQ